MDEAPPATRPPTSRVSARSHGSPFDVYVVIDPRTLERACFVQCLANQCDGAEVRDYGDVEAWKAELGGSSRKQVLLVNFGSRSLAQEEGRAELTRIVKEAGEVPVVVLGARQDIETCIATLDCGAAGYIPPCVTFTDIVQATWLAVTGGIFLPRESLLTLRRAAPDQVEGRANALDAFTERQIAVADALRCGAANKTIAYELSLRESTVKVHIRNIFQKLKATNRTEAAFLLNQMTGWPSEPA